MSNCFIENDQDQKYFDFILELVKSYKLPTIVLHKRAKNTSDKVKKSFYLSVIKWIEEKTFFLDELAKGKFKVTLLTRLWWVLKGDKVFPICEADNCQTNLASVGNVKGLKKGYPKHCCIRCVNNDSDVRNKIGDTKERNYGDRNYSNREQAWNTTEIRYGVRNPYAAEEVKAKIRQTNRKNLGVNYPMQNKDVLNKAIASTLNHLGVKRPLQDPKFVEKAGDTYFNEHGVRNPSQNPDVISKRAKKYTYDGNTFDSKPEIALYIWLRDHNIQFEYQLRKLTYIHNGKEYSYYPDFYLNEANQFIEVKGRHFFNDAGELICPYNGNIAKRTTEKYKSKLECMKQNHVYIALDSSPEIKGAMMYVKKTYGKNYLNQFKNK